MSVRARVSSPPRLEDVAANAAVDSADNPMSNSGDVQYLTLRQTMTWEEVVDTLNVTELQGVRGAPKGAGETLRAGRAQR